MAHLEKYTKTQIGALCRHDTRTEPSGVIRSNENIDKSKTHLNYNLAEKFQPLNAEKFLKQRLSQVKVLQREDVKVMCSWCLTLPKTFPKELEDEFFKKSFDFLCNRYGKENVITACVHKDETTPHLHFKFVPVKIDNKGQERCCAKEVVNRSDLRSFHSDLKKHLENEFGFEVEIMNGATEGGDKKIQKLQAETYQKQAEMLENEAEDLNKTIIELREEKLKTAEKPSLLNKIKGNEGFVEISVGEYSILCEARHQMSELLERERKVEEKKLRLADEEAELENQKANFNERVQAEVEPLRRELECKMTLHKNKEKELDSIIDYGSKVLSKKRIAEVQAEADKRVAEANSQLQSVLEDNQKLKKSLDKVLATEIDGYSVEEIIEIQQKQKRKNMNYER